MKLFLKGNVPSSKNSKQWTGKFLVNSKTVNKYLKEFGYQYKDINNLKVFKRMLEDKEKPYKIKFTFIRNTKRKFDYINAAQLPCDLMVKYGWIDDDNCDEIVPVFGTYSVDKEESGVFIEIL